MAKYREEAGRFGDESQDLMSVRNIGYFRLSQNLRYTQKEKDILEEAIAAQSNKEKKRLINLAIETAGQPAKARRW